MCTDVLNKAQNMLKADTVSYKDGSLLDTARHLVGYMEYLGFAYNMTSNEQYARKALEHLNAASEFESWDGTQFLDTAEMTYAVAMGYKMLGDYLSDTQKTKIRQAIIDKGLKKAYSEYISLKKSWSNKTNNWNQVCNGSMIFAACAIKNEDSSYMSLVPYMVENLKNKGISRIKDDGSYFEGPNYWNYAMKYLHVAMMAVEDAGLESQYKLSEYEKIHNSAWFGIWLNGNAGSFNYNDNVNDPSCTETTAYIAHIYNDSGLFATRADMIKHTAGVGSHPFDLMWYGDDTAAIEKEDVKLYSDEKIFIGGNNKKFSDTNSLWVAIKGQEGTGDRMDLDCGSFVLDYKGVRFAHDLGSASYSTSGYWDCSDNGTRWNTYKKRAEAHNTIVINPEKDVNADGITDADQYAQISTPMSIISNTADEAIVEIDMTSAYKDDVSSSKRTLRLYDSKSKVSVKDTISFKKQSDFYWLMNTKATLTISSDGKMVELSENSRKLKATLISDADLRFTQLSQVPLTSSISADTSIQNYKKLAIVGDNISGNLTLEVVFEPVS